MPLDSLAPDALAASSLPRMVVCVVPGCGQEFLSGGQNRWSVCLDCARAGMIVAAHMRLVRPEHADGTGFQPRPVVVSSSAGKDCLLTGQSLTGDVQCFPGRNIRQVRA